MKLVEVPARMASSTLQTASTHSHSDVSSRSTRDARSTSDKQLITDRNFSLLQRNRDCLFRKRAGNLVKLLLNIPFCVHIKRRVIFNHWQLWVIDINLYLLLNINVKL